jgi:hypothetical protein
MLGYCAPPPGNMKTTSGASPKRRWVKTRRGSPASSIFAASSWVSATSTRRCSKARRPCFSVQAMSASGCSGWARRCAARRDDASPRADWLRAERVMSWKGQSDGADAATAGASCTTTCALVPPTPKEFTPARRGPLRRVQSVSLSLTRNGLFSKSMAGFGASKLRLGGIWPWCSASVVLIRLATPAAVSRWPMLVFTLPMRAKPLASVVRRKASVRAATSMGSPR